VLISRLVQIDIWDVFLFDSDFSIERPKRLYKKGLSLFTPADDSKLAAPFKYSHKRAPGELENGAVDDGPRMGDPNDPSTTDVRTDSKALRDTASHTFYLWNAERKLKLVAKNERQMDQFIASIERLASRCIWAGANRFGSFAPIRLNAAAQWLINGVSNRLGCRTPVCILMSKFWLQRDYFWNLSRAILLAKVRIGCVLYYRKETEKKSQVEDYLVRIVSASLASVS
jgi:phospholipase D1/2